EEARAAEHKAALQSVDVALDDQVALAQASAGDQQIDAGPDDAAVGRRERHLLADHRRQVAVEREQELFDVASGRIVGEADVRTADVVVAEHRGVEEAEQRVDAAVVQKAEAADLRALEGQIERILAGDVERAEHADLLIQVAQVRDLDDLFLVLETG